MKTTRTYISHTTVTDSAVEITVQPKGTDSGYNQITLRVVPQDDGCIIVVGGLGDRVVGHDLGPANYATLVWRDRKDTK